MVQYPRASAVCQFRYQKPLTTGGGVVEAAAELRSAWTDECVRPHTTAFSGLPARFSRAWFPALTLRGSQIAVGRFCGRRLLRGWVETSVQLSLPVLVRLRGGPDPAGRV